MTPRTSNLRPSNLRRGARAGRFGGHTARLVGALAALVASACTPAPEDHGAPAPYEPANNGATEPHYQSIPDSFVADVATTGGGDTTTTTQDTSAPTGTDAKACTPFPAQDICI